MMKNPKFIKNKKKSIPFYISLDNSVSISIWTLKQTDWFKEPSKAAEKLEKNKHLINLLGKFEASYPL